MSKPVLLAACCSIFGVLGSAAGLHLAPRATSCFDPSFTQCSAPGVPQNFCCPGGSTCIPFNGGSSIICCPDKNCDFIQPISCDISQQNATAHPLAAIKSTKLDSKLETCGSQCCPEGYDCRSGQCSVVKKAVSSASSSSPSSASSTASGSPTPSSSSAPSHGSAASSLPAESVSPGTPALATSGTSSTPALANLAPQCKPFPASAVLLGFFLGLLAGTLLVCGGFFIRARRKRHEISPPIEQPLNALRTDFLRRSRKSEATSMEFVLAQSPHRGSHAGSRMTAFADLMEGAGFRKGEPYVMVEGRRSDT